MATRPPPKIPDNRHAPIDLQASLRRVAQGKIPLRAEQRLADEMGAHSRLFTSDLSVREFVLVKQAKCEPISQVMGSSIFHVGQIPDYKGATGEITVIGNAHRASRKLALDRMWQEAALVGADAVIGVHLRDRMITMGSRGKGGDDGGEILEFTAVGTAIRAPWITHPEGSPIITDLSGQDLWALAQDGFEPTGFLFEFCRYHVWHVTGVAPGSNSRQPLGTIAQEIKAASDAVDSARNIARDRLLEQASLQQAEFVVGSDLKISVREVPCGSGGCPLDDLDVDVSWLATGIRRVPGVTRDHHTTPPLVLSMMPLGARRAALIDDDDDEDEVRIAAEEAEEAALEADEGGE